MVQYRCDTPDRSVLFSSNTYAEWLNDIAKQGWGLKLIQGLVHIFEREVTANELN